MTALTASPLTGPPITLVVPTLNAQNDLLRLEKSLVGSHILIANRLISDGGSSDDTVETARHLGWRVVTGPPGRGRQLAAGAARAETPWLLFLHADSLPPPGWMAAVTGFISNPANAHKAAYFRFALDAPERQARWLEKMVAWRCRLFALPYGDQGLLIATDLYRRVGGYRDLPLMEDVDLISRLKRRDIFPLPCDLKTSAIRYQDSGYGRRVMRNILCLTAYWIGIPPHRIAAYYNTNKPEP